MTRETVCDHDEFLVEFSEEDLPLSANGIEVGQGQGEQQLPALPATAYKRIGKIFLTIIAAQLLVLTGFAAAPAFTLSTGKVVVLKTVPVDPYDMCRGEYVTLRYEISRLPCSKELERGRQVFVVLRQSTPYWRAERIDTVKPIVLPSNEVAMKAKVEYSGNGEAELHYGIERYYVPEGVGKVLQGTEPEMRIAVDFFGNSVIKEMKAKHEGHL